MDDDAVKRFYARITGLDKALIAFLMLFAAYGLALLPFGPKLLVDNPQLLAALRGSGVALVAVGAESATTGSAWLPWLLAATVVSSLALPVFYVLGRRWGEDVLTFLFPAETPKWFRKVESSVRRFPALWLAAAYVPFSPIPPTIILALAGVEKVRWQLAVGLTLLYTLMLKGFYLAMGYRFGREVSEVIEMIDRYMLYFTLAILAYVMWKAGRSGAAQARAQKAREAASEETSEIDAEDAEEPAGAADTDTIDTDTINTHHDQENSR